MNRNIIHLLGNYKSRKVIYYYMLSVIFKPIDWLLSGLMKIFHSSSLKDQETTSSPIFIIGLPRSGTTILYQYLIQIFEVSYLNNLWAIFPKSAPYFPNFCSPEPKPEFSSFYGNGLKLKSAQEGGRIFNRWFPDQENHYYKEIEAEKLTDLKEYFDLLTSKTNRPALIKSGRNIVRLEVIKKAFPNARFIRLSRDPLSIARSIYNGRIDLYKDASKNLTVKPKEWLKIKDFEISKQLAYQVYYLDKQIDEDLKDVPADCRIDLQYEDFCNAPYNTAKEIATKFNEISLREHISDELKSKKFTISQKKTSKLTFDKDLEKNILSLFDREGK